MPITAYRVWELQHDTDGWKLRSVAAPFRWDGPFARADKRPLDPKHWDGLKRNEMEKMQRWERADTIKHVIYTAGIHAVKDMAQIKKLAYAYNAPVWGEVHLWGRVAQFQLGYRAEFCMIRKLWLDVSLVTLDASKEKTLVEELTDRYQCDVEVV